MLQGKILLIVSLVARNVPHCKAFRRDFCWDSVEVARKLGIQAQQRMLDTQEIRKT